MKLYRMMSVVLVAGLMVGLSARSLAAGPQIVTANPVKVFEDMQERKDLQAKMDTERKGLEDQNTQKRQEVDKIKDGLKMLKSDSPQYQAENQKLLQKAIEYDAWAKMVQLDAARRQKQEMVSLFDKIQVAIGKVATEKGIDLVITDQRPEIPDDLEKINMDQLRGLILGRSVLFSSGKLDITQDVVTRLNADYAKGPAK